jgi:DNA (cytosine-5)-methyltransferase 3A
LNVLSLFDGIGCGKVTIEERLGIAVQNYFSSEIKPAALSVLNIKHPSIIQLGSVLNWKKWRLPKIDLLLGGSPCQGFSSAGLGLGFEDPRSKLFFIFVEVLRKLKPRYFLLENVKMRPEWLNIITAQLGVRPIILNSALVSAQHRIRYYWTNIKGVPPIMDREVMLRDIIEPSHWTEPGDYLGRCLHGGSIVNLKLNPLGSRVEYGGRKTTCMEVTKLGLTKSRCITTVSKDAILTPLPMGRYPDLYLKQHPYRRYTMQELCKLQTLPSDYLSSIQGYHTGLDLIANAWTVDIIAHILKPLIEEQINGI